MILTHFDMLTEQEEPEFAMHKLRTFTGWYTHGLPDGRQPAHPDRHRSAIPRRSSTPCERFFEDVRAGGRSGG